MSGNNQIPITELGYNCETARIIVIDDEQVITDLVATHLELGGFTNVMTLNDSRQATAAIAEYDPDLVLLDISMPHVDGMELLKQIRSNPELDDVVVLILSAARKNVKYRSLRHGARGFVDKPVVPDELLNKIRDVLRVV